MKAIKTIIVSLAILVTASVCAATSYAQVAWADASCYYDDSIVNGWGSVSVGYEMGYYYDTSIALVLYDPSNNIVAAQTNYINGYSHAHDDVNYTPTEAGTYLVRVYLDVTI